MSRDDAPRGDGGAVVESELPVADRANAYIERVRALTGNELATLAAAALGLLVFPWLLIEGLGHVGEMVGMRLGGYEGLPSLVLIYGIIVIGFNLLLGYTGLLSFGHAAFFGTAAYTAALLSSSAELTVPIVEATVGMPGVESPLAMVVVGTLAATLLAWPIGFMSIRRSGVYFAVLTLTFGQMLYFFALGPGSWLTNGDNGFSSINVGPLLGAVDLGEDVPVLTELLTTYEYLFVAVLMLVAIAVANRIVKSPYGLIFKALGQNEQRVEFVGLNVFRYKLMAFVISGAFAGAGGALFVMHESYIHPGTALYWIQSGDFVIMSILGGTGSLVGPVFGAFLFEYISNVISGISLPMMGRIGSLWRLILGAAFVIIVWVFPRGIYGALKDLVNWLARGVVLLVWAAENPGEVPGAVQRGLVDYWTWIRVTVAGYWRGLTGRVSRLARLAGGGR